MSPASSSGRVPVWLLRVRAPSARSNTIAVERAHQLFRGRDVREYPLSVLPVPNLSEPQKQLDDLPVIAMAFAHLPLGAGGGSRTGAPFPDRFVTELPVRTPVKEKWTPVFLAGPSAVPSAASG